MTRRRSIDPLSAIAPVARVAAVGLVAAGGLLGGQLVHATTDVAQAPAAVTAARDAGSSPNAQAALREARTLLAAVHLPPGSSRLSARPANAPTPSSMPFLNQRPELVTRTEWWQSSLSPSALAAWLGANPPAGLMSSRSGSPTSVSPYFLTGYMENASGVLDQINLYAEAFTLPDGRTTGLQLIAAVVYRPERTAQETVSGATQIVATPTFPGLGARAADATTVTNPSEIAQVEKIINALPTQPLGTFNCPEDTGGSLGLTFESGTGARLAQVQIAASGCGSATVTAGGKQQPELAGSGPTVQQIQTIIGTHWQLMVAAL